MGSRNMGEARGALLALVALFVAMAAPCVALEACPVESQDRTDIEAAIGAVDTCAHAYHVMSACRSNDGGDVSLADLVIQKCEEAFLPKLEPPALSAYRAAREACVRRFAGKAGSMYASFQASCEAAVAVVTAKKAAR